MQINYHEVMSPCVGECSTSSQGDLVCRGCFRRVQEVQSWISMDQKSKERVIERLDAYKTRMLRNYYRIQDEDRLKEICMAHSILMRTDVGAYYYLWQLLNKNGGALQLQTTPSQSGHDIGVSRLLVNTSIDALTDSQLWQQVKRQHWDGVQAMYE